VAFLIKILDHPVFRAGDLHTGFVDEHAAELIVTPAPSDLVLAAATFARSTRASGVSAATIGGSSAQPDSDPWSRMTDWGR
jgi:3-methylcrotonyl-CoA carboxylase alpha subunit